ncbi:penicillin-binding protein activator LpoB [Rhodoferax sp.]|uniref:penicillin-binding protein activator LpoB n=1 Tax=Rhodoferax sp. TaxID=50421 RepID=UPI00274EE691|nr:penicillin-binding protein activator LpoB [Rhodoferax sp.]MDP2415879.1 penicillin-binding protein activator LpoB [Hydrogenophaga sp.]MDZ4207067.1 penicillin-binding protein activator LpoB [Rhodoferax sp.]
MQTPENTLTRRPFCRLLLAAGLTPLAACQALTPGSSVQVGAAFGPLQADAVVALLPVANYTDVPQAGLRALALLEPALRLRGVQRLLPYPSRLGNETMFEPGEQKAQEAALVWAREQGARYAVFAAVNEWRYKTGIDGEPAVGMALLVRDLSNDRTIYAASGGRTGWARESLAAVAQQLINELLAGWRRPAGG